MIMNKSYGQTKTFGSEGDMYESITGHRSATMNGQINWPLMQENISWDELDKLSTFLTSGIDMAVPRLTQGPQVSAFEREFADWLGVKYAVMVNSGASANLITMHALRELFGTGEVIVPCITWSSDIMSVIHAGLTPVFVDIDPRTLGADYDKAEQLNHAKTIANFTTHCLGFPSSLVHYYDGFRSVPVIEDCCESIGATRNGRKLGTFGRASNFSFYYGHHMTTIEGGMICTDDEAMFETCRVLRSHGMTREIASPETRKAYENLLTWPDFTFEHCGFNMRSTEINAVIGRSQLKRLDVNNLKRNVNLNLFLENLEPEKYRTDYPVEGSSNFALPLVLQEPDDALMQRVLLTLDACGVEYRRGTAGGGNQLRQPYLRRMFGDHYKDFPQAEHVHNFGLYVGNYPNLDQKMIAEVCEKLNAL